MKYAIDFDGQKPKYLQLYEQVKQDVVGGVYAFGHKLPSKRTVAEETGLSVITVEHAYALLAEEGYVEARQRSGYFVVFRPDDGFAVTAASCPRLPYHTHDSVQFPFSVLAKTMRKVLDDYGEAILEKTPNAGATVLREALRRYLAGNRGVYVDVEQIVVGSGAEYLYGLVAKLFDDVVIGIESPSYDKIEKVYRSNGVQCQLLPLGSDGIESRALNETSAQILHISPYRSFPTGVTATASKKHEYVRWAAKGNRFLVEDDFESEFSLSAKPETLFSLSDKVIYLNTFTRTLSPALRVGYMVLPKCLVPTFRQRLGFYSCTVPAFEQYVLAELISDGNFERHINRVRRQKRKQLQS